jgi:hypothetical protein
MTVSAEAIKNAITQLNKPMEQYHLPSLEPLFVPLIIPNIDMAPYSEANSKTSIFLDTPKSPT